MQDLIANIIPIKRTSIDKQSYSYLVPHELSDIIKVGMVATVPFGKKKIRGIVENVIHQNEADLKYELKLIDSVDQRYKIPKEYLYIIEWISNYYLCSFGEAASLFLPPDIKRPRENIPFVKTTEIEPYKLTAAQNKVYEKIISTSNNKPTLLLGVTGSGKTEIYIKLIKKTLSEKKQVIFLVPEIMLATQTILKLNKSFGGQIALYHSSLSNSEKFNSFIAFNNHKKSILIGPRSALTVPSDNVGLIIIDEEHDDAYKQESNPRYHSVVLAERIANVFKARLILGSATPRIEDVFKAEQGKYEKIILSERYNKKNLPPATIIDLKKELESKNYSSISEILKKNIQNALVQNRQVLLLMNRLGMATFVSCRECGTVIQCPHCAIPLVYHLNEDTGHLLCHHCNYTINVPKVCPECHGVKIKYYGTGIEKVQRDLSTLFPSARIRNVNSKAMSTKNAYHTLYDEMSKGKIDIILGTQIIAKGLDLPSVDLVGIISADTGLHLPQYQANEKAFQLLTQVSGRSGRGDNEGMTIIQTYWPESFTIQRASKHDFEGFSRREIEERKQFEYPPFTHIVRIISENSNKQIALERIDRIAKKLSDAKIPFIGPGICFFSKLNGRHRYHIIVKVKELPDNELTNIFKMDQYLTWDVDPVSLL